MMPRTARVSMVALFTTILTLLVPQKPVTAFSAGGPTGVASLKRRMPELRAHRVGEDGASFGLGKKNPLYDHESMHQGASKLQAMSAASSLAMPFPLQDFSLMDPLDRRILRLLSLKHDRWRGSRVHVLNAGTSLAIPLAAMTRFGIRACLSWRSFPIMFALFGIGVDNLINAAGKFLGPGRTLRLLTKVRLALHHSGIPLLFVPLVQAAGLHGILRPGQASVWSLFFYIYGAIEFLHWSFTDSTKFKVVDNRDSLEHSVRYLAGTLTYTSGKVLQCVLPVVLWTLATVGFGGALVWAKRSMVGAWMLASGGTALLTCSMQRPDVQMMGEPISMALLWVTLFLM